MKVIYGTLILDWKTRRKEEGGRRKEVGERERCEENDIIEHSKYF